MDLLNATEDSSLCMCRLAQPALPISVCSDHCSLWHRRCSLRLYQQPFPLTPDAICLLHSVDLLALNYTVRSPLSHLVDPSLWRRDPLALNMNIMLQHVCKFDVSIRSILNLYMGIWCRHTHASCNAVPLVWGSVRLIPIIIIEKRILRTRSYKHRYQHRS